MMERIISIFYILPFRLLLNHLKENFVLIISWIFITFIILEKIGDSYGVPILFLNPEYLGVVGYFSFQLVGVCFGAFYITWNLVSYLLFSYRYPFLASLQWPFAMFTFNNSIIPFYFLLIYLFKIIQFQTYEMGKEPLQIFWMILGIFSGFILLLLIVSVYFHFTNKNIHHYFVPEEEASSLPNQNWQDLTGEGKADRVDYFLSRSLKFRPTREVTHYNDDLLKKVFLQHHFNAFLVIILNISVLIGLGFIVEKPVFEIPAAGTIFLFFSFVISLAGLIYYWSGKWGAVALIAVIIVLNTFSKFEWMQTDSQAYGLSYEDPAVYSLENLESLNTPEQVEKDILQTLSILNNWKAKNQAGKPYYYKPKMFIVLASGGGSRSATYTLKVMQTLDSLSNGEFMSHTALMSGASGGMLGLAYYRELYLREKLGLVDNLYSSEYIDKISADLINKIATTIVSNDLFFGFRKYTYEDKKYNFDRGTSFELAFNNSTDNILNKGIGEYASLEQSADIPLMFLAATNVADMRKLVISAQPVSYMMRSYSTDDPNENNSFEIDAIDFGAFFKNNGANQLRMSSALRMNATYPLILPNVSLPSSPKMDVFDAGIRDNFGIENTTRFLNVFQDWIKNNTSGVVIIQIRDNLKKNVVEDFEYKTFLSKMGSSFGSVYSNLTSSQDYLTRLYGGWLR
jgi:hypothetical protein